MPAERLHESCSASVMDGDEIVYVARAATNRIMTVNLAIGTRLPAYCTSMGRVLLAALSDDALDAYLDRVPLRALTHRTLIDRTCLRAVNAASHVARVSLERLHSEFIPALVECARSIDADLAGRRH